MLHNPENPEEKQQSPNQPFLIKKKSTDKRPTENRKRPPDRQTPKVKRPNAGKSPVGVKKSPNTTNRKTQSGTKTSSKESEKEDRLEIQTWYHGALPRSEISNLLVKDGDFLVRVTMGLGDEHLHLILSVKWAGGNKHIIIRKEHGGKWYIKEQGFESVYALVRHHQRTKESVSDKETTPLIRPVPRPAWLLRNESIKYDGDNAIIGSGTFAEVFKVKVKLYRNLMPEIYPAVIKKPKRLRTDEERKLLVNEAKLIMSCTHPNIVQCYGIVANKLPFLICLEYCAHGELLTYMKNEKGHIEPMRWCTQIADGMAYLELKEILHRDLAARNCLVGDDLQAKISDFGIAKRGAEYRSESGELKNVPIRLSSPETLSDGIWTSKSDVFSFGILLWEIYTDGGKVFDEYDTKMVIEKVLNGHRVVYPSHALENGISSLGDRAMAHRPVDRPSFSKLFTELKTMLANEFNIIYGQVKMPTANPCDGFEQ